MLKRLVSKYAALTVRSQLKGPRELVNSFLEIGSMSIALILYNIFRRNCARIMFLQ